MGAIARKWFVRMRECGDGPELLRKRFSQLRAAAGDRDEITVGQIPKCRRDALSRDVATADQSPSQSRHQT
jgi:hypothetical protein